MLHAYRNGTIPAIEISNASGLPCRAPECDQGPKRTRAVFRVASSSESAFKSAIFARDWHETVTHLYVHVKLPPAIASVVMSARGRSLVGVRDRTR